MNRLYYKELGDPKKQTVVFLHGLGATHRYWKDGIDEFAADFHLILVDLLGFGESPRPWQNYTVNKHVMALSGVLGTKDDFVLVGHSLGAILSIHYADQFPDQVKQLILISLPVFDSKDFAFRWMRRNPSGWLLTNIFTTALTCLITRYLARALLKRILKQFPDHIIDDLVKHNMFSSTTSLWNVIYKQSINEKIGALIQDLNITCLHSPDDESAPYISVMNLVANIAGLSLISIHKGGHHPWIWQKDKCINTLKSLIGDKDTE